jgi:thiol-disulfide isomerase/thioredoxin
MLKKITLLIAILSMVAIFVSCNKKDSSESSVQVYTITDVVENSDFGFVDFEFEKDGKKVKFSEFVNNNPVFLNFWGTWCPPCRKEIPDIIEISNENKNLIVTGIALERPRTVDERSKAVSEYAKSKGISYVNFVIDPEIESKLIMAYGGINAVPTSYILDKSGNMTEKIVGMRSKDQFMQYINPLIN